MGMTGEEQHLMSLRQSCDGFERCSCSLGIEIHEDIIKDQEKKHDETHQNVVEMKGLFNKFLDIWSSSTQQEFPETIEGGDGEGIDADDENEY